MLVSVDVSENLYKLIDSIKESKEYNDVVESLNNLNSNTYTKDLIDSFIKYRDLYEKAPTKENARLLSQTKKELYTNELYKDYINKLNIYNNLIERIEKDIDNALYSSELKNLIKKRCCQWLKDVKC